ncbi:splicing factor, arginine/serine-rich 19-like [Panicum virgatum]|uniref:Calmodulin-binding protein n=1 Tax=Panicum virgatum TaxID=38727 RepID=A0A8T0VDS2_PANVG|nr:splicing factor, arginine/serine-rich 19-like [Panicum virgatum]KAG2629949.1 hypothetical protein PVAP13_3KG512200 [Panicum virgatum]
MAASSGDTCASGSGGGGGDDSACSTPFVSAPSSPARDPSFSAAGCFYSAPASPARGGPGTGDEYGFELGLDFNFDFSSRCPSPAAAAMSSADELFHNGQIRPMQLASFLLRPQALPPLNGDVSEGRPAPPPPPEAEVKAAPADERSRFRSRSVHRRSRSLSPFRTHWLSPSSSPAPAASSGEPAAGEVAPSASRSSSSSSTASSASSSSRSCRRWGFLKDLLHRSKSDSGKHPPLPSNPPPAPKRNPSPAASRGRGRARTSAHARLYEARRAEAEEMRRRTFLPYRQGLLLGCLGLGSPGYGAMHGLAAAAAAGKSRP